MRTVSSPRPATSTDRATARRRTARPGSLRPIQLFAAGGLVAASAVGGLALGASRTERPVAEAHLIVAGLADPRSFDPTTALQQAGVEVVGLHVSGADVDDATRLVSFSIEAGGLDGSAAWKTVDAAAGRYIDAVRTSSRAATAEQLVRSINDLQQQLSAAQAELVAAEAAWRAHLQTIPIDERLDAASPTVDASRDEVERITAELSAMRLRSDPRTVDADQPVAEMQGPVAVHTELVGVSPWRGAALAAAAATVIVSAGLAAVQALHHNAAQRAPQPTRNQIGTSHP